MPDVVDVIRHDITVRQGKTFRLRVVFLDAAGAPVDLTQAGYLARAQIRVPNALAATPAVDHDSDVKGGITMNSDGEIDWVIEDRSVHAESRREDSEVHDGMVR